MLTLRNFNSNNFIRTQSLVNQEDLTGNLFVRYLLFSLSDWILEKIFFVNILIMYLLKMAKTDNRNVQLQTSFNILYIILLMIILINVDCALLPC